MRSNADLKAENARLRKAVADAIRFAEFIADGESHDCGGLEGVPSSQCGKCLTLKHRDELADLLEEVT